MSDTTQGQQSQNSGTNDFNAMAFLVSQMISRVNVATLVKVLSCSNAGEVSPVGTVDVQILVNQLDGAGKPVPHVTVYGLPYLRLQGGANAVILDPQIGDIGVAVFSHHDISAAKANRDSANPGSRRRNSIADGLYFGGMLNAAPQQYVRFSTEGIKLFSPTKIELNAPEIDIKAATLLAIDTATMTANATTAATINSPAATIAGGGTSIDGKNFLAHKHGGVATGASLTQGVS